VDGETIGTLDGFTFRVDPAARLGERKMLLAAAERYLAAHIQKKAKAVVMAGNEEFSLAKDAEGKPALFWNGALLGHLAKGRTLLQPLFKPARAVAGLEGDALREIVAKAEGWVQAQLAKNMGGIVALNQLAQDAATDGIVRALAARLADAGGIAGRQFLADTLTALPKEARGAARKAGIVFGALDVYHHAILKPAATRWRAALFAALEDKPMPDLPPESAVHLKEWDFASAADCRNAGYRRVGTEYVRIDLAERVIKKAHESRGQTLEFGMDMAFATSLGLSEEGLNALMRDAGFRRAEAPVVSVSTAGQSAPEPEVLPDNVAIAEAETNSVADASLAEPAMTDQSAALTYWRWIGLRKARPQQTQRPVQSRNDRSKTKAKPQSSPKPAPTAPTRNAAQSAPSALALQLAALKDKLGG
jgi:ATP-dependent RNA helicase SUPV3L1/SUV3